MSTLSIVFDIASLFIVALFVWLGVSRGFLQSAFRLFSTFIALILARNLFPYTKLFLERIFIKDFIKGLVVDKLNLSSGVTEITEYSVNSLNLPNFVKKAFLESNYLEKMQNDASATLASTISDFVADYALTMLSYVLTFIIVSLVILFILLLLNVFSKLPVIHFCNAGLGGAAGFVSACIIIWLILAGLNIFLASPSMNFIFEALDRSMIARVFYKFNPIVMLISGADGGL